MKKELPRLQQVVADVKVKAGEWECVVLEAKTLLPVKKQYVILNSFFKNRI